MKDLCKMGRRLAATAAVGLGCASYANAGSITQPGETIGLATGAPLPQGVFFVDTANYGPDRAIGYDGSLGVNTPALIWSTPWTIAGARIEFLGSTPEVVVGNAAPANKLFISAWYNPYASISAGWDLGNGFGFTDYQGVYFPIDNALGQNFWVYNNRSALSYTANGWNITGYTVLGITGTGPGGVKSAPNYFNYDITVMKDIIGKWSIGGGVFGSTDLSGTNVPTYKKQAQFAIAGLVGYNFGSFTGQVYVSHDVYDQNYVIPDTRVWFRMIMALWTPPAPVAVTAKY